MTFLWKKKENEKVCGENVRKVGEYAQRYPLGHWPFVGPCSVKKWYGTCSDRSNGSWDWTAENMLENFQRTGHPIFRCTSVFERRQLKSKGWGRITIHFTTCDGKYSVDPQDDHFCQSFQSLRSSSTFDQRIARRSESSGRLVAEDPTEQEILILPPVAEVQANDERRWDLLQEYERKFEKTTRRPEVIQIVLWSRFELGRDWTIFSMLLPSQNEPKNDCLAENTHYLEMTSEHVWKGGSKAMQNLDLSRTVEFANHVENSELKLKFHHCSRIRPHLGSELRTALRSTSEKQFQSKKKKDLRGDPLQGAKPILKLSSKSEWDFIPLRQWRWIDSEVQKFKDPSCFQVSKFITNFLRHKNVGFPHSRIVEECKKVLSEDPKYWTEETRQRLLTAPFWSANKWIKFQAKGGGNKKRFQYCETGWCRQTPVPSSNSRSFRKKPILEMLPSILHFKTFCCYQRISPNMFEINSEQRTDTRMLQHWNGQAGHIFTVVNPMEDKQSLRETFCVLSKARIAPYKNIWKRFQDTKHWCN